MKKQLAMPMVLLSLVFIQAGVAASPIFGPTSHDTQSEPPSCGNLTVALVVDPQLAEPIRASIDLFVADLCTAGYNTIENSGWFSDPAELRNYLRDLYEQPETGLAGAILVGDIPRAYQWFETIYTNPDIPPLRQEVISFQYYSDLDGTFEKSPGYVSSGGHEFSYDIHSGAMDWEIWVSVLPYYKGKLSSTIEALNRYFAKNHAFRSGLLKRPNAFLQISELQDDPESLRAEPYTWSPFSQEAHARLYAGDVSRGYEDLSAGVAVFTVVAAHGYWGASGQLSIADVEENPVRTIGFWSSGCAIGNLDHSDNFLTSILYSKTSEVLVAKGTTNDSGGMGSNEDGFYGHNIATALSGSASLGDAILSHVNVPLIYPWSDDRELHFSTLVVLGDPTLQFELRQDFEINAGQAGTWFNPATPGQGQLIDVEPENTFLFLSWFTFTDDNSANPLEQHWFTAQGNYTGNHAELILHETLGGRFDDPQAVSTQPVGTVTLRFTDCGIGLMDYSIFNGNIQGSFPLQRAIPGTENLCVELAGDTTNALDPNDGRDGAWFDEATPGQGFLVDAHPDPDTDDFMFVAWFTYGDDSASGQRWLTAQGPLVGPMADLIVYETTGGSFDEPVVDETRPVGSMTIDFTDCSNALLTYSITDEVLAGIIEIQRAIPGTEALCEELTQ